MGTSAGDVAVIPLFVLVVPLIFAFINIVIAYLSSVRYKKMHVKIQEHEWLLQQKGNSLAILKDKIVAPLSKVKSKLEELYKSDFLSTESYKKLIDAVAVSASRIQNLSTELQRSTFSITKESVDIVPFYRSATTVMVILTTTVLLVVVNSVLASTETAAIGTTSIIVQIVAFIVAMIAVVLTSRYKRIATRLLVHSKATIRLQQEVDDAKDHIISLVVKIISADITKLKTDITLMVDEDNARQLDPYMDLITEVIARLELMSNIESRLIKSDVKLLNVEDLIEEIFREHQSQLNERGIQVEHFHRVGASKIQLGIVQDRALLKTAVVEVFKNAIEHTPEQSVIKIVSEHSLTGSSITVTDQAPGGDFEHTPMHETESSPVDGVRLGVGLYIADQIMHILGGEVHIIHSKNVGNSVKLTFINNYVR